MVGLVAFISLSLLAACQAGAVPAAPVQCGAIPTGLFKCLRVPPVVKTGTTGDCGQNINNCEQITCMFRKLGWMDGDKVDKSKVAAHYDQYATEHPAWQAAVDQTKTACLQADLPPQGIHLNCPTYDIMQCGFTTFIKSAQPSEWSSDASCDSYRQFVASCPICPQDCFAAQVPVGSCNSCLDLPRSS